MLSIEREREWERQQKLSMYLNSNYTFYQLTFKVEFIFFFFCLRDTRGDGHW